MTYVGQKFNLDKLTLIYQVKVSVEKLSIIQKVISNGHENE